MKDTYSIKDLMIRYCCAASTIYRHMNCNGYPRGGSGLGSRKKIAGQEVYAWELKHMPWLHPQSDASLRLEEDEKWNALRVGHEERLAKGIVKQRMTVKPWGELRREVIETVPVIKTRRSRKAAARRVA